MTTSAVPTAPVVAGVDGSAASADAAHAAAREASLRGRPLRLVRAFHWPPGGIPGLPDGLDGRALARRSAERELRRIRDAVAPLCRTTVVAEVVDGPADLVLRQESTVAELVVVGASGSSWAAASGLGSVASAVAHCSHCTVLVHRTPRTAQRRHGVAVGVDGSRGSRSVLDSAAEEAVLRQVPLRVLHAWRQVTEDDGQQLRWRLDDEVTARAERADITQLVTELRSEQPELEVELTLRAGRAGPVLATASRSADLLVLGRPAVAPGRPPGPTFHSLVQRAASPVLIVPVHLPGQHGAVSTGHPVARLTDRRDPSDSPVR